MSVIEVLKIIDLSLHKFEQYFVCFEHTMGVFYQIILVLFLLTSLDIKETVAFT
jgi:hypothetical protein